MIGVLIATEPILSRETLAQALATLRPQARVLLAAPQELEVAILRDSPDLIICSHATDLLTTHAASRIVPHPGGAPGSVVGTRGTWQLVGELPLSTILDVVDRVARDAAPARR